MWVFCGGMIRAGSTVQYQIAAELVERFKAGQRVPHFPESEFGARRARFAEAEGWLVVKAHVCSDEMEEECRQGRGVVLYSYRDFRDVALSAMAKFGLSFGDLLASDLLEMAVREGRKWRSMPRVLVSRYEEMTKNLRSEVARIGGFLGFDVSDSLATDVAEIYSLARQLDRIEELLKRSPRPLTAKDILFDEKHLLHHNHIRTGASGERRRELTREEVEALEQRFGWWLDEHGYRLSQKSG